MDILSVGIDAKAATQGANEFDRAADKMSASAGKIQRDIDRTQRKVNQFGSTGIKDTAFQKSIRDLDREFDKALRNIDRQLDKLESGGRKAAAGLDTLDRSSRNARSGMGQFIEAIAQGDPGELLGEIAQQGGKAGIAIAGVALVVGGTVLALGALTKALIDNVKEVDKLARDYKLAGTQVQALQTYANLTGESVEDLAENYKKLNPEVKRLEQLIKDSGAAVDNDLRKKVQDVSLAWESLKIVAEGALNTIGRELLPVVTIALQDLTGWIKDLNPTFKSASADAAEFFTDVIVYAREAKFEVSKLASGLSKIFIPDPKVDTFGGAVDKIGSGFSDIGDAIKGNVGGIRAEVQSRIKQLRDDAAAGKGLRSAPSFRKASGNSDAAQEAKALFDAQIALERTNARNLLDLEKRRIDEQRTLIEADYDNRLLAAQEFFAEKIRLHEQEKVAEIRFQEELLSIVERQQARAKKPSEKLAFEDDLANIRATIQRLSDESAAGTQKLGREGLKAVEEEAKKAREAFKEYAATVRELELQIREAREGTSAVFIERFRDENKAIYDQIKAYRELAVLLAATNGEKSKIDAALGKANELEGLVNRKKETAQTRLDFDNAGKRFGNLQEGLALEEEKINRLVNERVISEDRGLKLLTEARKKYRDGLLEELNIQEAILRNSSDPRAEEELLRIERQRVAVEQLGFQFTELQQVLQQFGDNAKSILQDAFYQGIVEGPRAFFQTLLQGFAQLLAQMAAQLLASQVFKLLGSLGQSASAAGSGGGGGFWGTLLRIGGSILGAFAGGGFSAGSGGSGAFAGSVAGAGFASGGYVNRAGIYGYGELGPEPVFMPGGRAYLPEGAYVQSNAQMRQSAQGQPPPVVNITVYAQDVNSFKGKQTEDQIALQYQSRFARSNRNGGFTL